MIKKFVISLLVMLSLGAYASPLETMIVSIWDADSLINAQNFKIKAAELDKFARFLPNNPVISYADSDNQSWKTYGVSLAVGLPGKAFALHKVDSAVLKAEKAEMVAKKIELALFVLQRYASCAASKELLSVLSEAVKELDVLKEAITSRYEMGQSTQAERIGILLQYRQANIEYLALVDQTNVACDKLTQLVKDRELDSSLAQNPELPEDFSSSVLSELGSKSLDLIRAENDSHVSAVEADVSFWRSAPDLTFSYYRNYYNKVVASPIIPNQWTSTFLVSINIPLLYPFYERSEIMRAKAENQIIAQRSNMKRIESEKTILDSAKTFVRNREIYKKLKSYDLPMAETMIDSTYAAYKQGKLGFSELILAKRTWLDLKKEEVNLKLSMLNSRMICLNACERN